MYQPITISLDFLINILISQTYTITFIVYIISQKHDATLSSKSYTINSIILGDNLHFAQGE